MTYLIDERKGDARILIISGVMLLCIISGGLLLCLYLFLPESQSNDWYPIGGITLVAIPWIFWFFVLLYNCFKPAKPGFMNNGSNSCGGSRAPPPAIVAATNVANQPEVESPLFDSPGGGKRRVHFGAVVVMGNQQQRGQGGEGGVDRNSNESHSRESRNNNNVAMRSRENEVPLRSSSSISSS